MKEVTNSSRDKLISSQPKEQNNEEEELRRGPWTLEEDTLLIHYVASQGEGRWNLLAKSAGLKRTGKSCRLRWLNYLKPDIKRGNLTPEEQLLILELHSKWGNRWSKIAAHLPGRTDNEIKNYWRTRVQKQARQLNMESNSPSFINAIRCFYMPRLVQKIEQNSTTSTTLNSKASTASSPSQKTSHIEPSTSQLGDRYIKINDYRHFLSSNKKSLSNILENPQQSSSAFPTPAYGETVNSKDIDYCHYVDMDPSTMSASGNLLPEDCHMSCPGWLEKDMGGERMWDLDDLWQFRK